MKQSWGIYLASPCSEKIRPKQSFGSAIVLSKLRWIWAWVLEHLWALWAAIFLAIAAVWLVGRRKPDPKALPPSPGKLPTVWEEAAALGAEEAAHQREVRDQIVAQRSEELGKVEVKEEQLEQIKRVEDQQQRNEEIAAWLEREL